MTKRLLYLTTVSFIFIILLIILFKPNKDNASIIDRTYALNALLPSCDSLNPTNYPYEEYPVCIDSDNKFTIRDKYNSSLEKNTRTLMIDNATANSSDTKRAEISRCDSEVIKSSSNARNLTCDTRTRVYEDDGTKIHFINVGYGAATILEHKGHFALIDAGYYDTVTDNIVGQKINPLPYINKIMQTDGNTSKKFDFIVGTHAHNDHLDGIPRVANKYVDSQTKYYYKGYYATNEPDNISGQDRNYCEALYAMYSCNGNKIGNLVDVTNKFDYTITLGDSNFKVTFLGTGEGYKDESVCIIDGVEHFGEYVYKACKNAGGKYYTTNENRSSLGVLVTYNNIRVLITGDMGDGDENRIAEMLSSKNIDGVDVYMMSHHGAFSGSGYPFVSYIAPKDVVISNFMFGDYSNNNLGPVCYMQRNFNSNVYVTGYIDGAVLMKWDDTVDKGYKFSLKKRVATGNTQTIDDVTFKLCEYQSEPKFSAIRLYNRSSLVATGNSPHLEYMTKLYYFDNPSYPAVGYASGNTNSFYKSTLSVDNKTYSMAKPSFVKIDDSLTGWHKLDDTWYYGYTSSVCQNCFDVGWKETNDFKYNDINNIIYNVNDNMQVSDLLNDVKADALTPIPDKVAPTQTEAKKTISILDANGNIKSNTSLLHTGDILRTKPARNSNYLNFTISVTGDVTGNGTVSIEDVKSFGRGIIDNTNSFSDIYTCAADYDGDGVIKMNDILRLLKEKTE